MRWLTLFWLAGSVVAAAWWVRGARRLGLGNRETLAILSWVVPAAIIGARLLHVLGSPEHYLLQPGTALGADAGFSLWGALLGGGLAGVLACRRGGVGALSLLDLPAPGLALGEAIGRLGCLVDGSGLGAPTGLPWGVVYAHPAAQPPDYVMSRHPSPLYHALAALAMFPLLMGLQRRPLPAGTQVAVWLGLHALSRLTIGFVRAEPTILFGLQFAQRLALIALVGVGSGIIVRRRRAAAATAAGS